jgi:16S rRNA (guanine527-N7)-methyltransferase
VLHVLTNERLAAFADLVQDWAPKLDLVAPGDLDRFEERHIADSLRLLDLLSGAPKGPCIDVGSGAGLPGIPLAIASDRYWRLLEPRSRRAAFLEEVVRELGLDCEVVTKTAEDAAQDPQLASAHALATARALAPTERARQLIEPLIVPGGIAAIFIGASVEPGPDFRVWRQGIAIVERPPDSTGRN